MEKRNFIKIAALTASTLVLPLNSKLFTNQDRTRIKPLALKQGDSVRIIAPGTAVTDPDEFQLALEFVESLGLVPIFSENVLSGSGYKTRTVAERVEDLHSAFVDKSASAIFCIRGGYGSAQIIDKIDYQIIKDNPKVFCGYSDITALHSAIGIMTGLITFHSPVLLSPFNPYTQDIFTRMLFNNVDFGEISNPKSNLGLRNNFPIRTINPGISEGILTGGNLTLISSLVGTKYQIPTKGRILAIEDVGEPPYRIDRMLNQLRLAGMLDESEGIVFGKCNDCTAGLNQSTWDPSLGEVVDYYLKPTGKPSFYGLMFGHNAFQATLPLGCKTTLDANRGILNIPESCVN